MRRDPHHQPPLLMALLAAWLLTSACAAGGGAQDQPAPTLAAGGSAPTATGGADGTITMPEGAMSVVDGPVDIGTPPTPLQVSSSVQDPLFVYADVVMPDGGVTLACETTGPAGTLALSVTAGGRVTLTQDTGAGPREVDSDTMNPRDVPAPGEAVLLGLLCGEGDDGEAAVALSVDALGVQFVRADGLVGDAPFGFTVSARPGTRLRGAFALPGGEALGVR